MSAAASAKILRLNGDEGALRDLRFAVGDDPGPAAKLLRLWRGLSGRPPSLDPGRLFDAAARLDLAVDPNGLASSLKACAGDGDPVSAATKAAAFAFCAFPDAPAAEAEIFALWLFDTTLAIRLRWPRPVPLIATKILDPSLVPVHKHMFFRQKSISLALKRMWARGLSSAFAFGEGLLGSDERKGSMRDRSGGRRGRNGSAEESVRSA